MRDTVESSSPRPSVFSWNRPVARARNGIEPRSGTRNQAVATMVISSVIESPMAAIGTVFPTSSSVPRTGVTESCSSVPSSRSRTTSIEVGVSVSAREMSARTPGIWKATLLSSGLYQKRGRSSTCGMWAKRTACAGCSRSHSTRALLAHASAAWDRYW